jgi:glucose-6-phosphate 1-epimerase
MIDTLRTEFEIPESVAVVPGNNGLPKVVLTHSSGSKAEVHLHGGHVISWTSAGGEELLFLSRESHFAPDKPIRGGIPVCFPQFGAGALPQHGFARTSEWQMVRTELLDNGLVSAELQLTESAESLAIWPRQFGLALHVLLDKDTLSVGLQVINTGNEPFEFQTALHTYFRIADIHRAAVYGLERVSYIDALREYSRHVETRPTVRFEGETDRIYVNTSDILRLEEERHARIISIEKRRMPDVVIWNPWIDKSRRMPDFGDDEYLTMVCIETGRIEVPAELSPGARWEADTTFSCC